MDGFGINPGAKGNAIEAANTPNLTRLFKENPCTAIGASGLDVGLPDGQMGNSEVGHTNIGAGRVVYQMLVKISKSIQDGDFFKNEALLKACENCKKNGTALHLVGLLSDGGVHSHIEHLYGLLEMAKREGLDKVYIHCIMDGRDVSVTSGVGFIKDVYAKTKELGVGEIATVMGRYYAMDRDFAWDRVEKAYAAMVYGEGIQADCAVDSMNESYANGVTDEFIKPVVRVDAAGQPVGMIRPNDLVIFFNYRNDRAKELTVVLTQEDMPAEGMHTMPLYYCCMTPYDAKFTGLHILFDKENVPDTIGEWVSKQGLKQLRIAETEKYAHVTFFLNGGREEKFAGEERILVASPKVATYDLQPEMSAYEVASKCVERIESGKYDVIILNFANCDMVGHTGVFDAAVKAVETVDECVGQVVEATLKMGGIAMITADHGNAEQMLQSDGKSPMTAHTTNVVPFILCGAGTELREGRLADIAPTILDVMGLEQPAEMDGKTLIVR